MCNTLSTSCNVLLASVARRLQGKAKEMSAFDAFNAVQDHVLHAARAHIDRIILEAFVAGIDACEDDTARGLLEDVCDLYALSTIEANRAWFLEHEVFDSGRSKAVTAEVDALCGELRGKSRELAEGLGVPDAWLTLPREAIPPLIPAAG